MTIKELKGGIRYILNLMEAGEYSKDYAIDEITVKFIEWYKANFKRVILIEKFEHLIDDHNIVANVVRKLFIDRMNKHFAELEEK